MTMLFHKVCSREKHFVCRLPESFLPIVTKADLSKSFVTFGFARNFVFYLHKRRSEIKSATGRKKILF